MNDKRDSALFTRVNARTKTEAEKVFAKLGLRTSDAINVFLHQTAILGRLPFDINDSTVLTTKKTHKAPPAKRRK